MAMKKSIVTSPASYSADRLLSAINNNLDQAAGRAPSGSSDTDDPEAAPEHAIDANSVLQTWAVVRRDLRNAQGILRVAMAAAEGTAGLLARMREKIAAARNPGMMAEQRKALQTELPPIVDQIQDLTAEQASYNGVNIVRDGTHDVTVRADMTGGILTLGARWIEPVNLGLAPADTLMLDTTRAAAQADMIVAGAQDAVARALSGFRVDSREVENQVRYIERFYDTANDTLGPARGAALSREAARMVAFQVQQQLSLESYPIANQRVQNLLKLF